jgi:hypothetical protein
MALTDFKAQYDNAYEEVFQKFLVGKSIANLRFEKVLTYGASLVRIAYDISAVRVRATTRGSASTIDSVADSTETLSVNNEYEAVFHVPDGVAKQAGPLNPGEVIGGKIAVLVGTDLDARILYEAVNAYQTFDNGDLTTLASTGTPIQLTSTTIPQLATRMPAKLKKGANQILMNMAFVIDSYGASDLAQYLLGKQFDIVNYVFKNGDAGEQFAQAQVYISENLTGETTLTTGSAGSDISTTNTIVINGVTFTFTSTAPAAAGEISIAATHAGTLANLALLLEDPDTTVAGRCYALSATNAATIADLKIAATESTNTIKIEAKGGGRLTVSDTLSSGAFSSPFIHCYYGKKGAIDVVVQDLESVDMRPCDDRRGTNVFSSYLAGIKTFADGAKQFLDVQILA